MNNKSNRRVYMNCEYPLGKKACPQKLYLRVKCEDCIWRANIPKAKAIPKVLSGQAKLL